MSEYLLMSSPTTFDKKFIVSLSLLDAVKSADVKLAIVMTSDVISKVETKNFKIAFIFNY